jgi:hypothetical protein
LWIDIIESFLEIGISGRIKIDKSKKIKLRYDDESYKKCESVDVDVDVDVDANVNMDCWRMYVTLEG